MSSRVQRSRRRGLAPVREGDEAAESTQTVRIAA